MVVDCEQNPNDLIVLVGVRYFTVCDDNMSDVFRHTDHPRAVRIIDAEDGVHIDIYDSSSKSSLEAAYALCKLLNQEYTVK